MVCCDGINTNKNIKKARMLSLALLTKANNIGRLNADLQV